jgi:transcriptional regulator NrdR family protein
MNCPDCNRPTSVINSRTSPSGFVRRRRECVRCKLRYTTLEMPQAYSDARDSKVIALETELNILKRKRASKKSKAA